ncbi:MAG: uroporphyrinogen decarboxylase [Nitrososphaerota archaeon]|nr:uroporphyrinogen decarboxylase [Nitrososphaerota archaeon]
MKVSNDSFLDACNLKEPSHTPVWFMRQAGRYLPSYARIKGNRSVIDVAKDPELSSEVVVDAVRYLGVDAGIIFADIMSPLEAIGIKFHIQENVGPVIENPVKSMEQVDSLKDPDIEADLADVLDGIDLSIQKLNGSVPLIGFSGAPFTLAAYIVEGGPSRDMERTKIMMYSKPEVWNTLMVKLTNMVKRYLQSQIKHGVSAVQLFDSWVGCLRPFDYEKYVLPYTKEIFEYVSGVPKIHFCADSGNLIKLFCQTGPNVLSVDWRLRLDQVWKECGDDVAVQGNLDPSVVVAGGEVMDAAISEILTAAANHNGHIFNLGHGVLKETEPSNLRKVVDVVHNKTRRTK